MDATRMTLIFALTLAVTYSFSSDRVNYPKFDNFQRVFNKNEISKLAQSSLSPAHMMEQFEVVGETLQDVGGSGKENPGQLLHDPSTVQRVSEEEKQSNFPNPGEVSPKIKKKLKNSLNVEPKSPIQHAKESLRLSKTKANPTHMKVQKYFPKIKRKSSLPTPVQRLHGKKKEIERLERKARSTSSKIREDSPPVQPNSVLMQLAEDVGRETKEKSDVNRNEVQKKLKSFAHKSESVGEALKRMNKELAHPSRKQENKQQADKKESYNKHKPTRGKPTKKHRYIADEGRKQVEDVEVDHVQISQSISGEAGVVDLKTHGKRFTFNLKAMNNPSDVKVTLRGQDQEEIENIQKNLKQFISFTDKAGATFLAEKTGDTTTLKYGRFCHEEHEYLVEPSNEEEGKHAVKRSALASWDTDVQIDQVLRAVGGSVRRKRSVTEDGVVIANIGIKAMLDLSIYRHHFVAANNDSSLAVEYVTVYFSHIFNLINLRYANIQNPQLVITVSLVEIDLAMDEVSNEHFTNNSQRSDAVFGDRLLDDLRQEVMNDQVDGSGNYQFDHLMAFTYLDLWDSLSYSNSLLGIAYLSGICNHELGLAVSVVEASPNNIEQTVNIAAHELGHNLGANHDDNEECKADAGWIMSPFLNFPSELFFYFSCCSQREFWSTLAEGKQCTDTVIEPADSYEVNEKAGQAYDVNYICQLTHYTDACLHSFYENNGYNICEELWCVHPNDSSMCLQAGLVPPTGTDCEVDKWCIETLCVDKTENHTTVYHGPETCDLSSLPVQGGCLADQYMCDNGTLHWSNNSCYDRWRRCDQSLDCMDGSDEHGCSCPERFLPCGGNNNSVITECFHSEEYCNGWTSCTNGKDELNCNATCPDGYLRCDNYSTSISYIEDMPACYPENKQCDGNYDCYDLSDEKYPDVCYCDSGEYCEVWINGQQTTVCITNEMLCNGYLECENYEDEYNCTCETGYKQCANGIGCYHSDSECDTLRDCTDGSDEMDCTCEMYGAATCTSTGECIPHSWVCDFEVDCTDGSDEIDCATCEMHGYATCNSTGECIPHSWICDAYVDCSMGEDESNCPHQCSRSQYSCESGSDCVDVHQLCDGYYDCPDGDDEHKCNETCDDDFHYYYSYSSQFRCENGFDVYSPSPSSCIIPFYECDGFVDCSDLSDEAADICSVKCDADSIWCNVDVDRADYFFDYPYYGCIPTIYSQDRCLDFHITHPENQNCTCSPDYVSCGNCSVCVSQEQLCDGYHDCPMGEDESGCPCALPNHTCTSGHCISSELVCDGFPDCDAVFGIHSDEFLCNSTLGCNYFQIQCDGICVDAQQFCDGVNDCSDGQDERGCENPCPAGSSRCSQSISSDGMAAILFNLDGSLPPRCYNDSMARCSYSLCLDRSDVENCTCQDVNNEMNFGGNITAYNDDDLYCVLGVETGNSSAFCLSRGSSIPCNESMTCHSSISELWCTNFTTDSTASWSDHSANATSNFATPSSVWMRHNSSTFASDTSLSNHSDSSQFAQTATITSSWNTTLLGASSYSSANSSPWSTKTTPASTGVSTLFNTSLGSSGNSTPLNTNPGTSSTGGSTPLSTSSASSSSTCNQFNLSITPSTASITFPASVNSVTTASADTNAPTAAVEQVTTTPQAEAVQNAVMFSLKGMTVSEHTLLKEICLFSTLAYSATEACLRTSCSYASVASEAKRRRKRSAAAVTFCKEYFSRLPGYPQNDYNGDLQLAIYTLVPGKGVLNSQLLKQILDDAKTNISLAIGATVINLVEINPATTLLPTSYSMQKEAATETPKNLTGIYVVVGVVLGFTAIGAIVAVIIWRVNKGSMKAVHPVSDSEKSSFTSERNNEHGSARVTDAVLDGAPIPTPEPVTAKMVAKVISSLLPGTSYSSIMAGKKVPECSSCTTTSQQQSMAALEREGSMEIHEKAHGRHVGVMLPDLTRHMKGDMGAGRPITPMPSISTNDKYYLM